VSPSYHFLSWAREGLAAAVGQPEQVDSPAGPAASGLTSVVSLDGKPVKAPDLTLIGPGDVTGFDRAQIVRMFPRPGTTDAEPSMFPLVEFERHDLPWLVTPRQAGDDRLRPWLCLVVVEVGRPDVRFDRVAGVDLEVLVAPPTELPDPATLHLWAHAQVLLADGADVDAGLRGDPRQTVSRLVSPRLLRPFTAYRACVVPTFRITVQAILREDRVEDLTPAWSAGDGQARLPVLASWSFSTGEAGGFEELVDRLQGRPLPAGVGVRPLDVRHAGPGLAAAGDNALTQVESALRAPDVPPPGPWPANSGQAHFRTELAQRVTRGAEVEDEPVVAPPLYGGVPWHHTAVDPDPDSQLWVDQLNADPRERVAAGLGTTVVQREQEPLMEQAWRQLAAHEEAERERQRALFARAVGSSLFRRHLEPLADERAFAITMPGHGRLPAADESLSVAGEVGDSLLPNASDAMPFRRALRVRGELAARVERLTGAPEPFAGRVADVATTGLAVPYRTPDGILDLLEDPRELFDGPAREAVERVFVDNGLDDVAGLDALKSSLGANAGLAAMGREELAALAVPDGLGSGLTVDQVPELAQAQVMVQEGGIAQQLVEAGFGLQLESGAAFVAPKDERGMFLPVGIDGEGLTVLVPRLEEQVRVPVEVDQGGVGIVVDHGAGIDVMLGTDTALKITGGSTFAHSKALLQHVGAVMHMQVQGRRRAADWRGMAVHSIGELSVSAELAEHAERVDADGLQTALLTWGRDQIVKVVAAPDAKLGALGSIARLAPKAIADGLAVSAVGLARLPDARPPTRRAFDIAANVAAVRAAVNPATAIDRYLKLRLGIDKAAVFDPPMWTPSFPDPMWKPLSGISDDWILAGLDRIPPNTVTLAESNDRFVEAYLVGLNHELGRELVWREFPTDRRGTAFQRFWGVMVRRPGQAAPTPVPEIEQLAALAWQDGPLGSHKPDAAGVDAQLVLMIRGDLLRRYPGTIVFAVPDKDGHADFASAAVKEPIFGGALGDEHRFLGFDLTAARARAEKWWFVFAEPPTEPRFGLDTAEGDWGAPQPYVVPTLPAGTPAEIVAAAAWNNASWRNVVASDRYAPGIHAPARADQLRLPGIDPAVWGTHAADVARISFQQPVRASVRATDMLPENAPGGDGVAATLAMLRRRQLLALGELDA
jgi:hypothetical protein